MMKRLLAKLLVSALVFVAALELACQGYVSVLVRRWNAIRDNADHYYRPSTNRVLGYELSPGYSLIKNGRVLRINRFGVRDSSDDLPDGQTTVALLGDSVVFGTGFSQDETVPALLQKELDPGGRRIRVVNFGVPGYNLPELVDQLSAKDAAYRAAIVVCMLNPNDFCRRDTVYEGADDGLYRMYRRPVLKTLWCLRKLVYRLHKGDPPAPAWYEWVFRNAGEAGLDDLRRIADHCASHGQKLLVFLLPARGAYLESGYALGDMYAELDAWLAAHAIPRVSSVDAIGASPAALMTRTDHLTLEGNRLVAQMLADLLRKELAQ